MKGIISFSLVAVVFGVAMTAEPAAANWFKSSGAMLSGENHIRMLGSAPAPKPDDLRCVGDSRRPLRDDETCDFNPKSGHFTVRKIDTAKLNAPLAAPAAGSTTEDLPKAATLK